jgi:cytosine permease
MMTGGGIAETNHGWRLVVAAIVGVGALGALAGAQGMLGTRRRARFAAVAADSLGQAGARMVAAPVLAIMMIGWFGFNTALAGAALGKLIQVPARLGVVIVAALMLSVAWYGLDLLSHAALLAGCATVVLAAGGLHLALADHTGPLLAQDQPTSSLAIITAVGIIVGYGAAFALRTPDFTYDLAGSRDVGMCALFGLALPLLAFVIVGAVLQTTTGTWNLVQVLERVGSPAIGYGFMALGFTGSVLSNLHSGAVAFEEITPGRSHRDGLVLTGVLGTGLALIDYSDRMIPFLTAMALAAPCLIAVLWVDERRRRRATTPVRISALVGWAAGAGVGAVLAFIARPWALPAGLGVAAVVGAMLDRDSAPK